MVIRIASSEMNVIGSEIALDEHHLRGAILFGVLVALPSFFLRILLWFL